VVSSLRHCVQNFVCICSLFREPKGHIGAVTWLWAKQQRHCNFIPCRIASRLTLKPAPPFIQWVLMVIPRGKAVGTLRPLISNSEFTINWSRTFPFAPLHDFVVCTEITLSHPCMLRTPQICIQPVKTNVLPTPVCYSLVWKFVLQKSVFRSRSTDPLYRLWFSLLFSALNWRVR